METRMALKVVPDVTVIHSHPSRILNSWKEIAQYMRMGVRTVQRHETHLALPVHRVGKKCRCAVFAFCDEIDHWLTISPTRNNIKPAHACKTFSFLLQALRGHAADCVDCSAAREHGQNQASIAS